MPGIFRGPFCDCALWSLWEVFCRTLGSAARFTASRSSAVRRDVVSVFELRESAALGLRVSSELSLSKSENIQLCVFDALVSDEQQHVCVSVCVYLCVGVLL